jgi:hypothetical protein
MIINTMASKENIPIMSTLNKKDVLTVDIEKTTLDTCGNDNSNSKSHNDVDAATTTTSGTKHPAYEDNNNDQALSSILLKQNLSNSINSTESSDDKNEMEIDVATVGTLDNVHNDTSNDVVPSTESMDTNDNYKDDGHPSKNEGIEMGNNENSVEVQSLNNPSTDSCNNTSSVTQDDVPSVNLQRPVKRARTAYFIFVEDHRKEVQNEVKYPIDFAVCYFYC